MITLGLGNLHVDSESGRTPESGPSADIIKRLTETATWCSRRHLSVEDLRSEEFDPSTTLNIPTWTRAYQIERWIEAKYASYEKAVLQLSLIRSRLVQETNSIPQNWPSAMQNGRLLMYMPLENVADGASKVSSQGFFDDYDAPPWDTWIMYLNQTIYCWIPEAFYSVAQAGLDANPVDCIHWADWRDLPREMKTR